MGETGLMNWPDLRQCISFGLVIPALPRKGNLWNAFRPSRTQVTGHLPPPVRRFDSPVLCRRELIHYPVYRCADLMMGLL